MYKCLYDLSTYIDIVVATTLLCGEKYFKEVKISLSTDPLKNDINKKANVYLNIGFLLGCKGDVELIINGGDHFNKYILFVAVKLFE